MIYWYMTPFPPIHYGATDLATHARASQDIRDVKGRHNEAVGVGELWEKWKEMGVLDS